MKKKMHKKKKKNNDNEPRVKVSSLTCLFVYKVLNQEVLDDWGKFEVSLSEKMNFEKLKTRYPKTRLSCSHYQESEGFLGCLWQRIWSAIDFRLRSLKLRRELQVMQARR